MIEGEEEKVQVSIEGKGLDLSAPDELGSRSAVTSMVEAAHGAVRPRGGAGEVRDLEASRLELMVMGRRAGSHVAALPSDGDRAVLGVTCGAAAGRSRDARVAQREAENRRDCNRQGLTRGGGLLQ